MPKISDGLQKITNLKSELVKYKEIINNPIIIKLGNFDPVKLNEEIMQIEKQLKQFTDLIDKYNPYFADHGFINYEGLNQEMTQKAIEIKENNGIEAGIEYIANWYSEYNNWHHSTYALGGREFFKDRIDLFKKAIDDHKSGKYYSVVLILLSLSDGIADSIYLKATNTNKGFFSSDIDLSAWDSMVGHPQGLPKLKEVLSKSFTKVILEEVKIPYRHGILHGKVINYDNKYCAAVCWNLIFALVDWSDKLAKGERKEPKPEPVKPFFDSISDFVEGNRKQDINNKAMQSFKPIVKTFGQENQPSLEGIEPENIILQFFDSILRTKPNYKLASELVENYPHKNDGEKILVLKNQFIKSGLKSVVILSSNIKNMYCCETKILLHFENIHSKQVNINLQYFDTVDKPFTLSHNSSLGKWYISNWQNIIND